MDNLRKEWSAIVLTSRTPEEGEALKSELLTYQEKGFIHRKCVILVVDDPVTSTGCGVGSGGATINALLYAVEQLSARRGYHVLSADVLTESNILVFHHGRSYPFGSPLRAFTLLSRCKNLSRDYVELTTNFLHLYNFVTNKLLPLLGFGFWVCSTDMIIDYDEDALLDPSQCKNIVETDACIITVPSAPSYASEHGVVLTGQNGLVTNLLYKASESILQSILSEENKLQLVSGIVYMSVAVSERLLALQRFPAIENCTYLSTDVGSEPYSVSLFFDMLLAMCDDIREEEFMKRGPAVVRIEDGAFGDASKAMAADVRRVIWNKMRHFRLSSLHIPFARHLYLSMDLCPNEHLKVTGSLENERIIHSFVDVLPAVASQNLQLTNSCLIDVEHKLGKLSLINSYLDSRLRVDGDAFICNVDTRLPYIKDFRLALGPGLFLGVFVIRLALPESTLVRVPVVVGLCDALLKPLEETTYCNISWSEFLQTTSITASDLWPGSHTKKEQTIWNAKLFPVLCSSGEPKMDMLFWAFSSQVTEGGSPQLVKLERWRASWRYSLCDILQHVDLNADFQAKRRMFYDVFARQLARSLVDNENLHYFPYFQSAVVDGYSKVVLEALDAVASTAPPNVAARTLALTGDMLSCMARGEGGLRSGPAANEKFLPAFEAFEGGDFRRGVGLMKKQREEWSFKPDMLIRCARHYEGAAQICIRRAVATAKQFITLQKATGFEPLMDQWYVAECPARLDLSGGWTDTPPIAYEKGGMVVNVAVLIDGKKPIGAKVRRTDNFAIVLVGDDSNVQHLRNVSHFQDYCIPNAPGALLKACLLLTEIVSLDGAVRLEQQLRDKWNCGFEVVSWSNLPQGSGLGTSSILAAAVIAALWSATGRSFDNMSVIHAVLCVEQMLTTGGGWQDQVGGVFGGVKVGSSLSQLPLEVSVKSIHLDKEHIRDLSSRLLLIYTGKPRLAKNLLQNVVRSWYSRDSLVVTTCDSLKNTAQRCAQAFELWNYEAICSCISDYYDQKKHMAAGTEPASVRDIIRILLPHAKTQTSGVFAGSLAGAGGGGFLFCLLNDPSERETVCAKIMDAKGAEEVQIFSASVDTEGLSLSTVPV